MHSCVAVNSLPLWEMEDGEGLENRNCLGHYNNAYSHVARG